jgi:hypothetical protein
MSRNLDFKSETFRPYAQALGEATMAWNDFHMVLSCLFGVATRIPNKLAPDAMWNALKSDRAQREMLEALVGLNVINYKIWQRLRAEIEWVLKQATKLEDLRNNLLHSPALMDEFGEVFAWHHLGHKRAKHFAGKDVLQEAKYFYDTVIVLREYTETLIENLNLAPDGLLPGRPSLPNRGRPSGR